METIRDHVDDILCVRVCLPGYKCSFNAPESPHWLENQQKYNEEVWSNLF